MWTWRTLRAGGLAATRHHWPRPAWSPDIRWYQESLADEGSLAHPYLLSLSFTLFLSHSFFFIIPYVHIYPFFQSQTVRSQNGPCPGGSGGVAWRSFLEAVPQTPSSTVR